MAARKALGASTPRISETSDISTRSRNLFKQIEKMIASESIPLEVRKMLEHHELVAHVRRSLKK